MHDHSSIPIPPRSQRGQRRLRGSYKPLPIPSSRAVSAAHRTLAGRSPSVNLAGQAGGATMAGRRARYVGRKSPFKQQSK